MQGIGDGDDAVEASSATLKETEEGFQPVFFEPRPFVNLRLVDEVESLSPIVDIKVQPQPFKPFGHSFRFVLASCQQTMHAKVWKNSAVKHKIGTVVEI